MEIKKITKLKNGQYQLLLSDDSTINVYEDIIVAHQLLPNKKIDDQLLAQINIDNQYATSYNLALKYLNYRLRSEQEIIDYFTNKNITNEIINATITKLKAQNYINDQVFTQAFINDKILMTNWGPYKIQNELQKYGIFSDVNTIMTGDIIEKRVKAIIKKMTVRNKSLSLNMLKNKILNYLINIGYSKDMVINYIDELELPNEYQNYKKEYEKLYRKYKDKYPEEQLDKIIKNKLYQKGFDCSKFTNEH
ncbi:MAG: RecX family transcriptional regulator [Bacilli bacterium]|jgi:regulatory protein